MKRSSKLRGMILAGVLSLALAGCGKQTQETAAESGVQAEKQVQEQTETLEEAKNEEKEAAPVELAAGFDEEFVLKPGEKLYIGREGISIAINYILYEEYGTTFGYTLTMDGKEIGGTGFAGTQIANQISQDEFTENRVCCIGAEEDKSVTLLITSGTIIPEPITLSGNASDEYVTTKPEYVVHDDFILFLDEEVKVKGNTLELIEKLIRIAEKESGLYMKNDSPYSEISGNETDWLYGNDVFPGVDTTGEKFHIYVVDYDVSTPCAYGQSIVINPMDLEIEEGNGSVILHEVLHCLQIRNGVLMDSIMDEGFATYLTGRICDKDEEMNFNFDATMNYSGYDREITKENAEKIFCEEKEANWENYLYGFRFITYLFETYGESIYRDIMEDACPQDFNSYSCLSSAEVVVFIKENTADTVFEDFAVWLEENEARFNPF